MSRVHYLSLPQEIPERWMLNSQRVVTSSIASSGTCSGHAPAVSSRHLPRYKVRSKCSQLNNSSCLAALEGNASLWCPVKASTEPRIDSPGHSSEEKCSVWYELICTHTCTQTKETTTQVYGGSVTLTCQRGKGRGKQCDQLHFECYLQLCTEVNHLSEWKRWASK